MAKSDTKQTKPTNNAAFLICFGLLWLIAGMFYYKEDMYMADLPNRCTVAATAEIYSISTGGITTIGSKEEIYTGYINYTVDGTEYQGSYESKDVLEEGQKVEIMYDPNQPGVFYPAGFEIDKSMDKSTMVVFGIGSLMIVIGGVLYIIKFTKKNKKKKPEEV